MIYIDRIIHYSLHIPYGNNDYINDSYQSISFNIDMYFYMTYLRMARAGKIFLLVWLNYKNKFNTFFFNLLFNLIYI